MRNNSEYLRSKYLPNFIKGTSDTEILLELSSGSEKFIRELEGMFHIIYDNLKIKTFSKKRVGIKPLYFKNFGVEVSSEIKILKYSNKFL